MYLTKMREISLDNKYTKWYLNICSRAQQRSSSKEIAKTLLGNFNVEKHHILPKSFKLGGEKDCSNHAYLTLHEHFVVHRLMTKMFQNKQFHQKSNFALASFLRIGGNTDRLFVSEQYVAARTALISAMTNREVTQLTKDKQSIARKGRPALNKGKPGKKTGPCSIERATNISNSRKNTPKQTCPHCNNSIDPGNYKLYHGDMCKLNPFINKSVLTKRSEDKRTSTLKSIAAGTHKHKSPNDYGVLICPHCGKTGTNMPNMKKNHFERCKLKT